MEVPPFKVLAAALRKTTEHLAKELAAPTDSPPRWTELEWAVARSVAAMQGISTLLENNLRWLGPPAWQTFLAEQRNQSILRDVRISALLQRIDTALRDAGIACVALKGSALRALELYRPGERPMGDIDLLVRGADVAAVAGVMRAIDYAEVFAMRRHTVYEPRFGPAPGSFGEHIDNPLKIEIHTAVAELLPARRIDITAHLQPNPQEPGLNAYPSLAALMRHLLLHTAGNMRSHTLRQVQLNDIAALASRFRSLDWGALFSEPRGDRWWMFPPLALATRYYVGRVPADVLSEARTACPRALRFMTDRETLTDVSWSNLRIYAFPGIAWSRTLLEALRFIRSRALPSRTALAELEFARQAQPQLDQIRWYGLPHGKRIVRWLFSRPPRVQTIVSVRTALGSAEASGD